jgi:hypothetical protein
MGNWNLQYRDASDERREPRLFPIHLMSWPTLSPLSVRFSKWLTAAVLAVEIVSTPSFGQQQPGVLKSTSVATPICGQASEPESKRIFGIVPNYRTSACLQNYEPVSVRGKFKIASQDSFDRGTIVLAAAFAGESQLTNANPSFGQGGAGYARYLGTSYADFVIGDYMTEAIFPSLLHQDPRYFRKGSGSVWSRLGYACGQIFQTHNDSGATAFNYSEILGNSVSVAISNSYYQDNRDARDAGVKLSTQLGIDAAANVLKEFWPDLDRKLSRKHAH